MPQAEVDDICRAVYSETKLFYETRALLYGELGFKILYSPPFFEPPVLFVGYQPGGDTDDCAREIARGAHDRWPTACEYATEDWTLACRMRQMFGEEMLTGCVGLNAVFIRAPKVEIYKKTVAAIDRKNIAAFCLPRVERLINAIRPRRVVAIGLETLDLFGGGIPDLKSGKGRTLTRVGRIGSRQIIATMHLSGAYISTEDRASIRDRILAI